MPKVEEILNHSSGLKAYRFTCPGCDCYHYLYIDNPVDFTRNYEFNDDYNLPTFTPNLLLEPGPDEFGLEQICHSSITDGDITYEPDTTHAYSGQTIPIPDVE